MSRIVWVGMACTLLCSGLLAAEKPTGLVDRTDEPGAVVTSQYTNSPAGEGPEKLFDNNTNSSYRTPNSLSWVQYQFGGGNHYTIAKYRVTSAASVPTGPGTNLVLNPSFETGGTSPTNWIKLSPFYEWWTPGNEPRGSGEFRGSAGVLIEAINELRNWAESQPSQF